MGEKMIFFTVIYCNEITWFVINHIDKCAIFG